MAHAVTTALRTASSHGLAVRVRSGASHGGHGLNPGELVVDLSAMRHVAVIGSGPAGLAAAQQLARAGHDVTVFEKSDRLGGLLRYGIPDFKMEKHLIDRRIEQMEGTIHIGIVIKLWLSD